MGGPWEEARIARKSVSLAHVDDERGARRADQTGELVGSNGSECGHDKASLWVEWTRNFSLPPRGEIAIPMPVMWQDGRDVSTGGWRTQRRRWCPSRVCGP